MASAQQPATELAPKSEQVFKNIQVFKGVPASELIPAMEFMAASLKFECSDCHSPKDFAEDTPRKRTARRMILMQRDIDEKNFNGRNEVTCMTCHRGSERPVGTPIPARVSLRHPRAASAPEPAAIFSKHLSAVGKPGAALVRTGTLTGPNDVTHKIETLPVEMIQGEGGKFRIVSGDRKIISNGSQILFNGQPMSGEAIAIFGRLGRAWRTEGDFAGLERPAVSGQDTIGKSEVLVVRGVRASTTSTEELYFDTRSGLLARLVNLRRSPLGTVVSAMDYSNYRSVQGIRTPMKVVATFPGDVQWIMDFRAARIDRSLPDTTFDIQAK